MSQKLALLAVCLLLALSPLIAQDSGTASLGYGMVAIIALVGLHLLRRSLGGEKVSFTPDPIDYSLLGLFCAGLVATASSSFLGISAAGLALNGLYLAFYLALRHLLKNRAQLLILVLAVAIGLVWTSGEGLWQYLHGAEALATWEDPLTSSFERMNRVYSTLLNPNLYAIHGLLAFPLVFALVAQIFSEPESLPRRLLKGSGLLVLALLAVFLVFQSGSRAAWLGLAAQLFLLTAALFSRLAMSWRLAMLGLGASVLLFASQSKSLVNRLQSMLDGHENSSNSFRLHVWEACLTGFQENIYFGVGVGSKVFYQAYALYAQSLYSALGCYSLPLELAFELGLFGLLGLGALLFGIGRLAFTALPALERFEGKLALACLVSLFGALVASFFDVVILRPQACIMFVTVLALLVSVCQLEKKP